MRVVVDGVIFELQRQGGISRLFHELLPRLCDADPALKMVVLHGRQAPRSELPRHPRIVRRLWPRLPAEGARLSRPTRLLRGLWRRAAVYAPPRSIWHSTYFTSPERWRGAQVVTVHDMIYERFPELFSNPEDKAFREQKRRCVLAADAILCVSRTTQRDVEECYSLPPGRTFVVPNAAGAAFRPLPKQGEAASARPFLLYVGTRHPYKNFSTLLTAYQRWEHASECDLVVVGGGPWSAEERERLRELSGVRAVGNVSDDALCQLYNQAAALVYPSLYEGFGIPLLEAMACGCPIVASQIPATVEVAGDIPLYFDPLSADDLCGALSQALRNAPSSAQLGYERARRYSWDATATATLQVYRSLIDEALLAT